MQRLTTIEGKKIFDHIAADTTVISGAPSFAHRILHAQSQVPCFELREAMIGKALDLGIMPENIERIVFLVSNGIMHSPLPEDLARKTDDNKKVRTGIWTWHTTLRVKMYDPFREEDVYRIFDPEMNPLEWLTEEDWTGYMKRRTTPKKEGLTPKFQTFITPLGAKPDLDPEKSLGHKQADLLKNERIFNYSGLELTHDGMFVNPEKDWTGLSDHNKTFAQASIRSNMMRRVKYTMLNETDVDQLEEDLVGKGFVEKYEQFHRWSRGWGSSL